MINDLIFHQSPFVLIAIVLAGLVLAIELPYRFGSRLVAGEHVKDEAWNTIFAGLLALVAFMLALSFTQAQGRFDQRRLLVVNEANAIRTAWLRADQLPAPQASKFRAILRRYAAMRLSAYSHPSNVTLFNRVVKETYADQRELWAIASGALRGRQGDLGISLLVESLNDIISVSGEQYNALTQHIPASVVVMTLILVFLGAAATGFTFARMQSRPTVFTAIYILALGMVFQMIVDYDRPQTGLVHVSLDALQTLVATM